MGDTSWYYRKVAAGVCAKGRCRELAVPGKKLCSDCAKKQAEEGASRLKRYKELEKTSGVTPESLAKHRKKARVRQYAERAFLLSAGVCICCKTEAADVGYSRCALCTDKKNTSKKAHGAARIKRGQCRDCPSPRADHAMCLDCRIKNLSSAATGAKRSTGVWSALKDTLVRQDFKCAITGEPIAPGVNASIDHIVPLSRGGSNDPSNLQWVTKQVNLMKSSMTMDEFIAMCRLIAERLGGNDG